MGTVASHDDLYPEVAHGGSALAALRKSEIRNEGQRMTATLTLPAEVVNHLQDALLQDDELERFAFVRCNPSMDRHLASTVNPVPDDHMEQQGQAECRPALEREREVAHSCYEQGQSLFLVHSHPFATQARFSNFDRPIMRKMSRWLDGLYGDDLDVLFGVLAQEELVITQFDTSADSYAPLDLELTGTWTYDAPAPKRDPRTRPESAAKEQPVSADSTRDQRFDRVVRALTESAPEELGETRVALVGAGGLGSILAEQLARLGVGHLNIIDPDVVERSNLPRLYGAYESDLDRPKVTVVAEHCRAIDSSITVEAYETVAEEATDILMASDIVVAGLDRMASRAFLNEFCVKHCLPYVDAGVVITTDDGTLDAMEGFVQTVSPGATACLACLNRIDRERARIERLPEDEREIELKRGYIAESDLAPEPAVVHLNTTIAGMAVSEVVNLVTGVDTPAGLIRFEALDTSLVSMGTAAARSEGCPVCGHNGVLAQGTADHSVVDIDETGLDLSFDNSAAAVAGDDASVTDASKTVRSEQTASSTSEAPVVEAESVPYSSDSEPTGEGDVNQSVRTTHEGALSSTPDNRDQTTEPAETVPEEDVTLESDSESEDEEDSDDEGTEEQIDLPLPYYLSNSDKGVFPWNR